MPGEPARAAATLRRAKIAPPAGDGETAGRQARTGARGGTGAPGAHRGKFEGEAFGMSIERFEEFLVLAGHLNYTAAARRLNITQSALSKHILALEKEFGVTLIDRDRQQIELTREGRIFCEEASKMIEAYHAAVRRLHEVNHEVSVAGAIKDSAIHTIMGHAIEDLRTNEPRVAIRACACPSSSLRSELIQRRVDIGIDVMDPFEEADPRICTRPFASVPLLAVTKLGTPLSQRESVTVRELASQRVMHPTGSADMQRGANAIEAVFQSCGVTMGKRIFFATSWTDFPAAELDENVFVMPRSLFSRQLFGHALSGCAGIPISDECARFPYQLSWRAGESCEQVLRCIDALTAAAETVRGRE